MTSVTDNRTTELRRLLADRGLEHEDSELTNFHDGTTTYYTEWGGNDDGDGGNVYIEYVDGTVLRMFDATPEQAIAATLGSEREIELGNALNEVAEKWAIAQVEAEDCAKRCMLLEELVRDMYDVAARGEFDVGEESKFSERMAKLGVVNEC